jgi:glycosyltransferase involved in cell wall biosynthesis
VKRILFVFGSLERAGAQLRTLEICRALQETYAVQCDFCSLGMGPTQIEVELKSIGAHIYTIPIKSLNFATTFAELLKQHHYDVINSEPKFISGLLVWLGYRQNIPIRIASVRNTFNRSKSVTHSIIFTWLMRLLIEKYATDIVGVTQSALNSMFRETKKTKSKLKVIYNGLDVEEFVVPSAQQMVRQEFKWPQNSKIIINVARFSNQKNHKTMIRAMKLLSREDPSIRLLLVGDGSLKQEVADLVIKSGLQEVCHFAGLRADVPRLLSASNVFFFPSLWEGLPGAVLEALASGLPVVASDIAPNQEIANFFPDAIKLAPPNDAAQFASYLQSTLCSPPDRLLIQESFQNSPFTLEKAVDQYSSLYGLK